MADFWSRHLRYLSGDFDLFDLGSGVECQPCRGFPSCQFSDCHTPLHSRLRVRHETDRRTDRRRPSTLNALTLWGGDIKRDRQSRTRHQHSALDLIMVPGSQPAGDRSHKPGDKVPLLSARPAVTFPAAESITTHWPLPNYTAW